MVRCELPSLPTPPCFCLPHLRSVALQPADTADVAVVTSPVFKTSWNPYTNRARRVATVRSAKKKKVTGGIV